ncbi:DUF2294 domain-containing protein [Metaplanococcus flavidus]|uniref:DUF2294 domain-containing protein n=1 Tax=Metaplanococcus flavidus TaxID=569883 RepID=A0ABW3LD46_9BACL
MPEEKTVQAEISGYVSTLLRKHFGKGPTSVFVTIKSPYIFIHFRGFISPMEKTLLKQNEWKRVLETRDLLLSELKPQIAAELLEITNLDFSHMYVDWNLSMETGLILGITDEKSATKNSNWPAELDKEVFHEKIGQANEASQRKPGFIESIWLNDRTLLVKRQEILVGIEKALIADGYTEVLKLTKRPLEQKLLREALLEKTLKRKIVEIFMDWDFDLDVGYIVFILEPASRNHKS